MGNKIKERDRKIIKAYAPDKPKGKTPKPKTSNDSKKDEAKDEIKEDFTQAQKVGENEIQVIQEVPSEVQGGKCLT